MHFILGGSGIVRERRRGVSWGWALKYQIARFVGFLYAFISIQSGQEAYPKTTKSPFDSAPFDKLRVYDRTSKTKTGPQCPNMPAARRASRPNCLGMTESDETKTFLFQP
jgi:hypothetical protein